jgi:hypothetical protein
MQRFPTALALAIAVALPQSSSAGVFRWVSMPDAQFYAENVAANGAGFTDPRGTGAIYSDITQWIVAQQGTASEIHYVQQLGDIVQNGEVIVEWELAEAAMDVLEAAGIIYGAAEGNHDCAFGFDECRDNLGGPGTGSYHQNYLTYFGPASSYGASTMAAQPWYRSSPSGASNAQFVEFEGRKFGFINLSIGNPQAELDWAKDLVANNPDRTFILGAHMLNYDGAFYTGRETELVTAPALGLNTPVPFYPRTFEPYPLYIDGDIVDPLAPNLAAELSDYTSTGEQGNFGQNVYQELTSQYPNVILAHSGHNCGENLRSDGRNSANLPVLEILTDYQCTLNGGDGWTRVYEFDLDNDTLTWYTISPRLGLANDPVVGPRPAPGTLANSSDTTGITRTPMDAFVDYLDFLHDFVVPTAVAGFGSLLEQRGVAFGVYSQAQFDQFKADDVANGTQTYPAALEQVVLALLGNDFTGASGFLFAHPDYNETAERTYYTNKLRALFGGAFPVSPDPVTFPRGWGNIAYFEAAWVQFFSEDETGTSGNPLTLLSCNDPNTGGFANKFNRCPAGVVPMSFASYATAAPSPTNVPALPAAFAGLLALTVAVLAYRSGRRIG